MEILRLLFSGFASALSPHNIIAAIFGGLLGLFVGALPGLGSLTGVALLLPLTFKMNPTTAIIMLAAIYYSNMYGGAFSAILINIPGDSPAVMTAIDGNKLTQKGQAGKALFTSSVSSFLGGTIGLIILTLLGPAVAKVGLSFGPAEMTLIVILGLTSIGWVIGDNPIKGLLATSIGAILATIGMTPSTGHARFTFGLLHLMSGVSFVPLVIGMFGFKRVIDMIVEGPQQSDKTERKLSIREALLNRKEFGRILPTTIRSGFFGSFVGVLPGAGATMASFLSYLMEKRIGKNRDKMGSGVIEGVAAPESANNAAAMSAFAPMLSLGIPGSSTSAVLMGGLMMWGLTPGPMLFKNNPEFVWGLISSMYIGNIICVVVAILLIPFLVRVVHIPNSILIPIITAVCVVGSYAVNRQVFDVGVMLVSALLACLMDYADIPAAPLLLAFVLTPMLERYINAAIGISAGSFSIFFESVLCKVLIVIILMIIVIPGFVSKFKKRRGAAE